MPGVRVQHPRYHDTRFTLSDPNIAYSEPRQCTPPEFGGCGQVHIFKTHHLNLDSQGAAIVNTVLYEQIKPYLFAHGFVETNEVLKPPTMGLGVGVQIEGTGAWGNIPIVAVEGYSVG